MENLLFTRVRDVKSPNRANYGDAGIDFYVPKLTKEDIEAIHVNKEMLDKGYMMYEKSKNDSLVLLLKPGARVLIPSGVRVLIDPKESMLMVANKSGISTKTGLVYTAEIIDSPYTGEVHIGVFNSSPDIVGIPLTTGMKIIQMIHLPIILSTPVEITKDQYESLANGWGTRGSNGFGSTDNK